MKKRNNYWVTLIELLVVISIIWIIALWAIKINFNTLSDKQEIEIFSNKVISSFETIRNYAIIWKWIGVNLDTPKKWKIEFSNIWSWNIKSSYDFWTWAGWVEYEDIIFDKNYEISEMKCINYDETSTWAIILWTGIIEILWSNLTLTWGCNTPEYKKIETTIRYKNNFEKKIKINTINWLVNVL